MAKRKTRIRHAEIVRQFAARLRELRQSRGVTQAELARQAHVALSHLSKLENGDAAPGLDLLDRLAGALGTTVTGLLPPLATEPPDARRDRVKRLFDEFVAGAGPETLAMIEASLIRFAESASSKR
jgi:transcriptional regulator with XRE-family HTH domain